MAVDGYLGPIKPSDVVVEIVHGCESDHSLVNVKTTSLEVQEQESEGIYHYRGGFNLEQGSCGFTVRIRPHHYLVASDFELPSASWGKDFLE